MFTLVELPWCQGKRNLVVLVDTMTVNELFCNSNLICFLLPFFWNRYRRVCQSRHLQPDLHQPDRQLQMPV